LKLKTETSSRITLALLYIILVFQPAMIWLTLSTGNSGLYAAMVAVMLFSYILKSAGQNPLTKQEATIITNASSSVGVFGLFTILIFRTFFASSSEAHSFGLDKYMPYWYVPPNASEILELRTFLRFEWLTPVIYVLTMGLLFPLFLHLALGLILRELYVEGEKLPFPLQQVSATAIETITEGERKRTHYFSLAALIGFFYSMALFAPPLVMTALNLPVPSIPIPWVDMSSQIQLFLPGAIFGIATDLLIFVSGLIVPFNVVLGIFVGSAFVWLIMNPVLINFKISVLAEEYFYGMSIQLMLQRAWLYVWFFPIIGAATALGITPLFVYRKVFVSSLRGLKKTAGIKLSYIVLLLVLPTILATFVMWYIIPEYPIWLMVPFTLGYTIIWTLVNGRLLGTTALTISQPSTLIVLSGLNYLYASDVPSPTIYRIWFAQGFAPLDPIFYTQTPYLVDGVGWTATFKVCQLTDTPYRSLVKVYLLFLPVSVIMSFMFVSIFWQLAPIPSYIYPSTNIYWPLWAIENSLFATGRIRAGGGLQLFIASFTIVSILYITFQTLHIPFSIVGFVAGMGTVTPVALTMVIGALTGKILERYVFGKEWQEYKAVFAAGLGIGETVTLVICSGLGLIIKMLYYLPY